MKALSVRQPWAWAILHGKRIENRTWASSFRGWVLIHATASGAERGALEYVNRVLDQTRRIQLHPEDEQALPRGAIVGAARIVDWDWRDRIMELHPGLCAQQWAWIDGPKCIVLDDVLALERPVRCLGRLGLWTVPVAAAAGVLSQLTAELRDLFLSPSVPSV